MNRTLSVCLICAGIFACGAVTGGLAARKFARAPEPASTPPPPNAPEGFSPHQLKRLGEHLDLTDVQREEILPILDKAGDQLKQLRRESFRQSSTIIEAMEASVAERLTPEQREKLVVLQEEQRARIRARMEERNRRRAEDGENGESRSGPPPAMAPEDRAAPPPR